MYNAIVYHTKGCHKCNLTANKLKPMNIELVLIDRSTNTRQDIIDYMDEKGLMSAPLVRVYKEDVLVDEWNDFNSDKIKEWHEKAVNDNAKD